MTTVRDAPVKIVPDPLAQFDPRDRLDVSSLIAASRNAYPVVAAPKGKDSLGLIAGVGLAAMLGLLTFWTMDAHRAQVAPGSAKPAAPAMVLPPPPPPALSLAPPPAATGTLIMPHTQAWSSPVATVSGANGHAREPMIVFDTGGAAAEPAASASTPTAGLSPATLASAAEASTANASTGGKEDDGFFSRIEGRNAQVAVARQLSNPGTTVTQGTLIGAVLETSINTDLPGYVRALVSRDVRSFDGSQVLIPRSSRLIGQYKSGLSAGQTRAYVIWTRLIRPDGVSVTLDSPGVDFGGSAGLPGKVNSHFMKRFGSALLLSVVGGLSAGARLITGEGGPSAASVAAGRDGSIPPTIRVAQGEPIRIFIARDLDFSSVPRLEASR